jgi:hypothetical protein
VPWSFATAIGLVLILGNPFRPLVIDPSWLAWNNGTVPRLACTIYEDRAHLMPELADTLERAGCEPVGPGWCRRPLQARQRVADRHG